MCASKQPAVGAPSLPASAPGRPARASAKPGRPLVTATEHGGEVLWRRRQIERLARGLYACVEN